METPHAVVTAVLRTLVRATADAAVPIVLRAPRAGQAEALAAWLAAAHGSQRRVVASACAPAQVEVRLPARMPWPPTASCTPGSAWPSQSASPATTFPP